MRYAILNEEPWDFILSPWLAISCGPKFQNNPHFFEFATPSAPNHAVGGIYFYSYTQMASSAVKFSTNALNCINKNWHQSAYSNHQVRHIFFFRYYNRLWRNYHLACIPFYTLSVMDPRLTSQKVAHATSPSDWIRHIRESWTSAYGRLTCHPNTSPVLSLITRTPHLITRTCDELSLPVPIIRQKPPQLIASIPRQIWVATAFCVILLAHFSEIRFIATDCIASMPPRGRPHHGAGGAGGRPHCARSSSDYPRSFHGDRRLNPQNRDGWTRLMAVLIGAHVRHHPTPTTITVLSSPVPCPLSGYIRLCLSLVVR